MGTGSPTAWLGQSCTVTKVGRAHQALSTACDPPAWRTMQLTSILANYQRQPGAWRWYTLLSPSLSPLPLTSSPRPVQLPTLTTTVAPPAACQEHPRRKEGRRTSRILLRTRRRQVGARYRGVDANKLPRIFASAVTRRTHGDTRRRITASA